MLPSISDAKKRTNQEVDVKYNLYKVSDNQKQLGLNKTYFILTYGCQMNEHDSENIRAIVEEMGFSLAESYETADFVILNTCAIRENVHNKVYGMLGRLKHIKESRKDLIIALCGCMAQEENVVKSILNKYKYVNFVFGTHNIYNLPNIIENAIMTQEPYVEVFSKEGDVVEGLPVERDSRYKAWVNIMYGCDKFCTYCIVPYTRGKQRSRKIVDIVNEVEDLRDKGYQEVTLLGQNVNAYGKDLTDGSTMAMLLTEVAKTNIPRVRFVTSHPWDFTDEMIDIIAKYDNIMPYIHLPIQSGSNRILKLMGRKYTKEEYLILFHKLKNKINNVAITTDVIVGFPNETDEDFMETMEVYKECAFDIAYTFIYSPREGTPAALMTDSVDENTKKERLHKLNKLVNQLALTANQKWLNKEVLVLLESVSDKNNEYLSGYTEQMKLVNVKCDDQYLGQIVKVKITDVKTFSMTGELING